MKLVRLALTALIGAAVMAPACAGSKPAPAKHKRNVIVFVADGLRYDSVTEKNAPTLWRVRQEGVDFQNSHAVYPTLTTANASAIATGLLLGDTGDYANTLYTAYPVAVRHGAVVTFLEDDAILHELKNHFGGDYLGSQTLLQAAHAHGMRTAAVGKLGPAAIQDLSALDGKSILIDDVTGSDVGPTGSASGAAPVDKALAADILAATGSAQPPAPATPNVAQQTWLKTAATKVLLPYLKSGKRGFVLLFWSRDPDATQHAQQDSPDSLSPGINGATSNAAITNADSCLKALLDTLDALDLAQTTDVFVTADHGFSTIAKSEPGPDGNPLPPHLPAGFLALSVANWLGMGLFDPDVGNVQLDPGEHPTRGDGIVGTDPTTPAAVIAANGGSDLLWFPGADGRAHAKSVFDQLMMQPYVGGIFINDRLLNAGNAADFAGALPMSDIGVIGTSHVPEPSMIVGFRSYAVPGCSLAALLCTAEIADTNLVNGQGMHGSFSRADTRNFMAAIGPDFQTHFVDPAPVGNADIAPTVEFLLGLKQGKPDRKSVV